MRLFLRGSIATVLLLVLVGCGVTGDDLDEAGSTTSTTSTTTEPDESTTTTEPESTTTTEGDTGEGNDPELEALLLTEADFEVAVELDPDEDDAFEEELCDGKTFTVVPERQAATGFVTSEETVVAQAIAEFDFEDDASLFIEELQSLNEQCKAADDEDAIPATFEPVPDLGDEAIRAIADPGVEGLELIVVRTGSRVVLLLNFGDEQLLTNPVIITAVDRATG